MRIPACLSFIPPCEPKPLTSETVTPRIPIRNRALNTQRCKDIVRNNNMTLRLAMLKKKLKIIQCQNTL